MHLIAADEDVSATRLAATAAQVIPFYTAQLACGCGAAAVHSGGYLKPVR
jgi:hypothetical protein